MYINLSEENSLLTQFISEIRDADTQKDRMRFRRNLERIGEITAYEISKLLIWEKTEVISPLGTAETAKLHHQPVLATILRAGLPLHQGFLNYFDDADNAFISAYRKHNDVTNDFEIIIEYLTCPELEGKTLLVADPMLATGQSIYATLEALKPFGTPKETHIISVIGAKDGVAYVDSKVDNDIHLWIASIDEDLNEKGYIIPGLGDAGDLAFGSKLQN